MFRIITRKWLDADAETCFDLARSIDLHLESMGHTRERAVGGRVTGMIGPGETVTWRARHFGCWFTMTSRITAMQSPGYFRDEMLTGPFARFSHAHFFQAAGSRTLMTDIVEVSVPWGFLGKLVGTLVLRRYLLRLIERRSDCIVAAARKS
ncbi:cell division protein [Pedobacter yulinensis]|uniref:Cell division protein n=1 Tax=Pedobacter yulinensis TaxID=2126353 RepID=A0A2T3HPI2_9SPHI|nr:SRPBCC family protein [Pedobacter yulinensis]PST84352.1 cell division protein [Pedobacter yulinensis]